MDKGGEEREKKGNKWGKKMRRGGGRGAEVRE